MAAMGPLIRLWEADVATLNSISVTFDFTMEYTKTETIGADVYVYTTSLSGSVSGTATVTPVDFSTTTAPAGSDTFALIVDNAPPFLANELSQSSNVKTLVVQDLLTDGTYNDTPSVECVRATFTRTETNSLNGSTPIVSTSDVDIDAGVVLTLGAAPNWDAYGSNPDGLRVFIGSDSGTYFDFTATLPASGASASHNITTLAGFAGTTITQTYPQPDDTATVVWSGWTASYQWDISVT